MTDELDGLERWVEAVFQAWMNDDDYQYKDMEGDATTAVLALAEPLRRAERVEAVDAMKFCPYCVGLFDSDKAEKHVVQCMRQAERVEELEKDLYLSRLLRDEADQRIEELEQVERFLTAVVDSSQKRIAELEAALREILSDFGNPDHYAWTVLDTEAKP